VVKDINLWFQETQWVINDMISKNFIPKHFITHISESKNKNMREKDRKK
jgi:hypothetical protein